MILLSGADLVLPDRILPAGTLSIDHGRIVHLGAATGAPAGEGGMLHGHTIVPGFIDVHVHGVAGIDTLDPGDAVAAIAAVLPRFGVTAFCPTTVACRPDDLRRVLDQVARCRETPPAFAARVLPAHLESNFLNPDYRGAQPLSCLLNARIEPPAAAQAFREGDPFTAADIVAIIEQSAPDIAVVTLAPEIDGGLDLVSRLASRGIRVAIGHSGATYDETVAAIACGVRHATHLFNRMPPLHHRAPGLAGAVLESGDVAVEVICDGVHVHPAVVRMVVAAKTPARVMAITDGTAAAALAPGGDARLAGRRISATAGGARLDDGTLAGSVLTMDEAFRRLTAEMGVPVVDAALLCATTPARQLGLVGHGMLVEGAVADLAVLDHTGAVVQTYVDGRLVYTRGSEGNGGLAASV